METEGAIALLLMGRVGAITTENGRGDRSPFGGMVGGRSLLETGGVIALLLMGGWGDRAPSDGMGGAITSPQSLWVRSYNLLKERIHLGEPP